MMLEYSVVAKKLDDSGAEAAANDARIFLETGVVGRADAINPAELLLRLWLLAWSKEQSAWCRC